MTATLADALEQEHHDIDGGIEAFLASTDAEQPATEALMLALAALRRHIYLEEEFLFPQLKAAGLFAAILVMLKEHGEIWTTMDAVAGALDDDPRGTEVQDRCRSLLDLLEAHNAKEEPIIYARADDAMPAAARDELQRFLAVGRLPDGWVCSRA